MSGQCHLPGRCSVSARTAPWPAAASSHLPLGGPCFNAGGRDELNWNDLSAAAGVPFRAVSDREYTAYLTEKFGLPPETAALLTALYTDFREGRSSAAGTLADLLDRPAVPGSEARVAVFPAQ
jgi:hypothetical protein